MAREAPSPIFSSRHSDGYSRGSMMQEDLCIVFSMTCSKPQRLGAILVELTVLVSTKNVLKLHMSTVLGSRLDSGGLDGCLLSGV
jgi:hypothetical protein